MKTKKWGRVQVLMFLASISWISKAEPLDEDIPPLQNHRMVSHALADTASGLQVSCNNGTLYFGIAMVFYSSTTGVCTEPVQGSLHGVTVFNSTGSVQNVGANYLYRVATSLAGNTCSTDMGGTGTDSRDIQVALITDSDGNYSTFSSCIKTICTNPSGSTDGTIVNAAATPTLIPCS